MTDKQWEQKIKKILVFNEIMPNGAKYTQCRVCLSARSGGKTKFNHAGTVVKEMREFISKEVKKEKKASAVRVIKYLSRYVLPEHKDFFLVENIKKVIEE